MGIENVVPNAKKARVVFVLESPHRAEVESGYPLAGASGIEISRILSEIGLIKTPDGTPFGQYLLKSKDERFAIINCSSLPMDKNTYRHFNSDKIEAPPDIEAMASLRRSVWVAAKKRRNKTVRDCQISLIKLFKSNWSKIGFNSKDILFVACGRISRGFLKSIGVKCLPVPHPSRNQWHYKTNKDIVAILKRKLSRKLSKR